MRLVFGIETELAAYLGRGDSVFPPQRLLLLASQRLVCLPGHTPPDLFLANGSRLYIDSGDHPEICTPECHDPVELVCYLRAGERMLAKLLAELNAKIGQPTLELFRCNVDYSGSRATWGSHESYRFVSAPETIHRRLVPHLVSRIVFTGAGGFDPFTAGLRFTLSPRVLHISRDIVPEMTQVRGLIHSKQESLGPAGTHRLHLMAGESLCSDLGNYLRVGTTALILAVLDTRPELMPDLALADPMDAIDRVTDAQRWGDALPLREAAPMTAVQMQKRYCEAVAAAQAQIDLPPWTAALCDQWWQVLTALERDPMSLQTRLDWPLKRAIYDEAIRERHLDEHWVATMTCILDQLAGALYEFDGRGSFTLRTLRRRRSREARLDAVLRPIDQRLKASGLDWGELWSLIALRDELRELDMRFSQIGPRGLFEVLDRAGYLAHRLVPEADVERAVTEPPATGRAHLRGRMIAQHHQNHGMMASWDRLRDMRNRRIFVMEDPREASGAWRQFRHSDADPMDSIARIFRARA